MKYSIKCRECGHSYSANHVTACSRCDSEQLEAVRDPNEVRREHDLKMMRGEMPWPCGEILPVKKFIDQKKPGAPVPNLGIMIKGRGPTVIFSNMFDLIQAPEKADTANSKNYPSYEAIIQDGWRVD